MSGAYRREGETIRLLAPAKVNLRLKILAREETGYHQLETLFCALTLADRLELSRGGTGIELAVAGAELGPPEGNLVYRAATAFFAAARIAPAVRIRLEKVIPAGAGLGGGSSDAAAALRALNELFGDPLELSELLRIGARLGSDVPFFLCGSPLALAWGRGERLLPLPALPSLPALIVAPPFAISTAEAYGELARARAACPPELDAGALELRALSSWQGVIPLAENDFEPPTYARYPELERLKGVLQGGEATLALLSGSGSALFALFPDEVARSQARTLLEENAPNVRVFETATAAIG